MPATRWSSHKDIAAKALRKLAGPHVPASLDAARAGRQARPRRLREGRGRRASSAARAPAGRAEHRRQRGRRASSTTRRSRRPPAGGPTRHPMVARPGGRAGGGGSARQRGGPRKPKEPTMARRIEPQAADRGRARRAPQGRPRAHRAGRPRTTDHRGLAALDPACAPATACRRYGLRNQLLIAFECYAARHHPHLRRRLSRLPRRSTAACARARRRSGSSPRSPSSSATTTARRPARSASSSAPSRSLTSAMTDPLPGVEPVPLAPPAEPIDGDSHQHLIAPLHALAAELGYSVDTRAAARRRSRRLVRPQAQADRRRHRACQPAGPHACARICRRLRYADSSGKVLLRGGFGGRGVGIIRALRGRRGARRWAGSGRAWR